MKPAVKSMVIAASVVLLAGVPVFADDSDLENKAEGAAQETEEAAESAAGETEELAENVAEETEEAAEASDKMVQNAWNEGKIETAFLFNEHLNNFEIDVEVDGSTAYLSGTVSSEVEVDLAKEVALGAEGIEQVESNLAVSASAAEREDMTENEFLARVKDATMTARIKTQLLANSNVSGMDINVNTRDGIVTLQGKVPNAAIKDLAEQIAKNASEKQEIKNELEVL